MRSPSGEIPATGRQVDIPFTAVLSVENSKLTSFRVYFDQLDMLTHSASRAARRRSRHWLDRRPTTVVLLRDGLPGQGAAGERGTSSSTRTGRP